MLLHHPDREALVIKLINGIDRFTEDNPELKAITALQIDGDWTPRTRSAYFRLLSTIKRERPELDLSVMVRLHQYRNREANCIPPADRGLLMCYNVAPVKQRQTRDAIYDEAILKGYLKARPTPFRWMPALNRSDTIANADRRIPFSFTGQGCFAE